MAETAAEPAAEPVAPEPEPVQEGGEEEAPEPEATPAEPVDHAALLEELAEHIRTIAASGKKDIYEAVAWLASHGI